MKIAIAGYKGRMGQMLVRELEGGAWPGLSFFGGTTRADNPENLFDADAVIDFTTPDATRRHIWLAAKHHKPIVIGTTGLSDKDLNEMRDASAECALLYSANMSVGVNLLAALVEQASARLTDFDVEILETHHRNKVDAPSGTALMLGRAAASGRGSHIYPSPSGRGQGEGEADQSLQQTPPHPNPLPKGEGVLSRQGPRPAGTIGYAVQRGGDVIGEHTVSFFGPGERLELTHRAHDRSLFAKGALRAAQWLKEKPHGFYSMRDVLEL